MKYKAYLFQGQFLAVNQLLELPSVFSLQNDLMIKTEKEQILIREVPIDYTLPEGYEFIAFYDLIAQWSEQEFLTASKAKQLLEWKQSHIFCSRCGSPTEQHQEEFAMCCTKCHYRQYPRIQPCVIVIITKGDQILLVKTNRPNQHFYGLVAGFIEPGETIEQAVHREVLEEVGLKIKNLKYLSSQPWPFASNLMLAFHAEYDSGQIFLQEEELVDAQFFSFEQLPTLPSTGSIAYKMIQTTAELLKKHTIN